MLSLLLEIDLGLGLGLNSDWPPRTLNVGSRSRIIPETTDVLAKLRAKNEVRGYQCLNILEE